MNTRIAKKFLRLLIPLALLGLSVTVVHAQETTVYRNTCKQNKAAAALTIVSSSFDYKPDKSALEAARLKLNTDVYCDCMYDRMEAAFGKLRVVEFSGSWDKRVNEIEAAKREEIQFDCFGTQIGRSNFRGVSPKEYQATTQKVAPPLDGDGKKVAEAKHQLVYQVANPIDNFRSQKSRLPRSLKELIPEGYAKEQNLIDPWGVEFIFLPIGMNYRVFSSGPDKKSGTADDVYADPR